jgi:predicted RNA-binding protein with PIN domain
MIERTAHRLAAYGEVLVVTDDFAERETVAGFGGMTSSCANFVQDLKAALTDLEREVKRHNQKERRHFRRPPSKSP